MIAPPWGYRQSQTHRPDEWPTVWVCVACSYIQLPAGHHREGCPTAALESTVEAMARALEGLLAEHEELIESEFGTGKLDPRYSEKWPEVGEARAALASWRALTGKEGERG